MPFRVDFYILKDTTEMAQTLFACQLTEKVVRLGQRLLLVTDTAAQAAALDHQLWAFRPESFIPHECWPSTAPPTPQEHPMPEQSNSALDVSVWISDNECDRSHINTLSCNTLINLGRETPKSIECVNRLAEIVIQQPEVLERTRARYTEYRQRGYALYTHDMRHRR